MLTEINIKFMTRFRFEVETCKIKGFMKILALLISLSFLTFLLFMVEPELFNMNFFAYTLVFDFLYVFTIFLSKGENLKKLAILLSGNVLSFIWNCLYPQLILSYFHRYSISNRIFQFINPVVNAFWIISMWAFGFSLVTVEKSVEDANL